MRPEAGPLGPAYGYLSTHGLSLTHTRMQSIPTYHSGAAKGEGKERAQRESIRALTLNVQMA